MEDSSKDLEEKFKETLKQNVLLQKECTLANNELEKLKKKNLDLQTKCQRHKNVSSDLNYKLRGCEVLNELLPKIVRLYAEIETLRDNLGKFVGIHEALNKIIKVQRNPRDKSGHGFKGRKVVHGEEVIVCYFCGKVGHETHKCKDLPEKDNPSKGSSSAYQHPKANKEKGPKKIWVPKRKIILVAYLLNSRKETPVMVP